MQKKLDEFDLKSEFSKVKEELSEHLSSINDNTNEIQANYEYLCEIENKIDKLAERLDELSMALNQNHLLNKRKFSIQPLSTQEKGVLLALYSLEQHKQSISYTDIAQNLNISPYLVQTYITNLIEKGIPIVKRYKNKSVSIQLDPAFKASYSDKLELAIKN